MRRARSPDNRSPDRHDGLRDNLDRLLRACIQCGLCLPHCATYLATGNEALSPRGRLLLLRETIGAPERPPVPPDASTLDAFDLCLACRACVSACPSGITFDLLEAVKSIADRRRRSRAAGPLIGWLGSVSGMHTVGEAARAGRALAHAVAGRRWRRTLQRGPAPVRLLARQLGSVPLAPAGDGELAGLLDALIARRGPATGPAPASAVATGAAGSSGPSASPAVAFFHGCANAGLLPDTSRRLRALLERAGCRVVIPEGQACCGALASHAGDHAGAARLRRFNEAAFGSPGSDVIIAEAAGCGLELRQHAGETAGRVRDAVSYLAALDLPAPRPVPLRVVCHDPCHARHGLGIVAEPRRLLDRIPGLIRLEADEPEVCCGSGGPYSLLHPGLSESMARRKAERLAATGADLIVTSNPGCLGQIADGLAQISADVPILPLTDLVWYACLGS